MQQQNRELVADLKDKLDIDESKKKAVELDDCRASGETTCKILVDNEALEAIKVLKQRVQSKLSEVRKNGKPR